MTHLPASPSSSDQIQPIVRSLTGVRARARGLLIAQVVGVLVSASVAGVLAGGVIDYVLRWPAAMRMLGLTGAGVLLALAVWRLLVPALRFRPDLTDLALRAERLDGSGTLRGRLASGLDLSRMPPDPDPTAEALRLGAVEAAAEAFRHNTPRGLLQTRPALHSLALTALAIGTAIGIGLALPQLASIGTKRILMPWSGAEWPKRFVIADATAHQVHAADTALPISGALLRSARQPGEADVAVEYRVLDASGEPLAGWKRAMLTWQGRAAELADGRSGALYERLIEPTAFAGDASDPTRERVVEYRLRTEDDETTRRRIRVVEPPALESMTVEVAPPDYAAGSLAGSAVVSGAIDAGAGADERAIVGPILAGSRVVLTATFNKPLPSTAPDAEPPGWLAPLLDAGRIESVTPGERSIRVAAELDATARLEVVPTDAFGLRARSEATFALEALEDRPATASVTEPAQDEEVLATAVIDLVGEARDDMGLVRVWLERQLARPPGASEGAPPEPIGAAVVIASGEPAEPVREHRVSGRLDLATLGVRAGDELRVTAAAADNYEIDGVGHEPARSPVRTLRVIDETRLIEQLRRQLGSIRNAAIRLDEQQRELSARLDERGATGDQRNQQDALTARVAEQGSLVERLRDRQRRNALDDPALSGLLDEAGAMLERAAAASSRAAQRLGEADQGRSSDGRDPEDAARDDQADVRRELSDLASLLDRGEDGWAARRAVERLLDEQRRLREQTGKLGAQTVGRGLDELTAQELSDLERIAQRQREAAEQAQGALDELSERGRALRENDPSTASAMSRASQQGRESGLSDRLEQASEQIAQNQTGNATQNQDEAIEALEEMLEQIDDADRNRDNALRRQLASIIQSIDALISRQERALSNLRAGQARGVYAGLDAEMIALFESTLAVRAEAETGFGETRSVADLLGRAADAQQAAVEALRLAAPAGDEAEQHERIALMRLREAKAEAERLDEQAQDREQEQQRRELRAAYRVALEEQIVLRGAAAPMIAGRLTRRQRAEARGIGSRQEVLRERVAALPAEYAGLADAGVFQLAHQRLDGVMRSAAESLASGSPDRSVASNQDEAVDLLTALVEGLADAQRRAGDFDGGGGGQGGQGGGQGEQSPPLIPPISELKLLRSMQRQAMEMTRAIADSGERSEGERLGATTALQRSLAERGRELLEKMSQGPGGPAPENPDGGPSEQDGGGGS